MNTRKQELVCNNCHYTTDRYSDMRKHLKTTKHDSGVLVNHYAFRNNEQLVLFLVIGVIMLGMLAIFNGAFK